MGVLQNIHNAEIYLPTGKVAAIVGKSVRWVQDNKHQFNFVRLNQKKCLRFELSTVISVAEELEKKKERKYQEAS